MVMGGQDVGPREQKEFSSSAECSVAGGGVGTLHLQKGPAIVGGSTEACRALGTASWALAFLPAGHNITSARGGSAKEREQRRVIWGIVCVRAERTWLPAQGDTVETSRNN